MLNEALMEFTHCTLTGHQVCSPAGPGVKMGLDQCGFLK